MMKRYLVNSATYGLMALIVVLILMLAGYVGHAHAGPVIVQTPVVVSNDPIGIAMQIYDFVKAGAHLPAVGAAIMLLVWAIRTYASKLLPWLSTPLGGYTLGLVVSTATFVGPALVAGAALTFGLFMQALGTAFAASGKWEGLRDLMLKMKNPPKSVLPKASIVALMLIMFGCGSCGGPLPIPVTDVVTCAKQDQTQIVAAATKCAVQPTWAEKESCVISMLPSIGWQVGGCVLADLVQQYLSTKGAALNVAESTSAHDALEHYRKTYAHNSTFRTSAGDL